jgi:hypothetical protein
MYIRGYSRDNVDIDRRRNDIMNILSFLLMWKTGVPVENHYLTASYRQIFVRVHRDQSGNRTNHFSRDTV